MKSFLQSNDIEMYSTHSTHKEGKSAITERFFRILKIKFVNVRPRFQKICILIN